MRKKIRRSQLTAPFGVGAIMDISGESLTAMDITKWPQGIEPIHEPRLARALGVGGFITGRPAPDQDWMAAPGAIPYFRFPRWMFCPQCRQMVRWTQDYGVGQEGAPICYKHGGSVKLVPMRFVMVCPRGHMADVPWDDWAHSYDGGKCEKPDLAFLARGSTSGLESLRVYCQRCKASRNLFGITLRNALSREGLQISCSGRQPWEPPLQQECDAIPQVVQRAASNLTFAVVRASIDIPPYSQASVFGDEKARIRATSHWQTLKSAEGNGVLKDIVVPIIARELQLDEGLTRRLVEEMLREQDGTTEAEAIAPEELYDAEYKAFVGPDGEHNARDRFIKRTVDLERYLHNLQSDDEGTLKEVVRRTGHLVQVLRLREVRALTGFSRLGPTDGLPDEGDEPGSFQLYSGGKIRPQLVRPDLGKITNPQDRRLPAVETYGEGVFVSFGEDALREWEERKLVRERARVLGQRQQVSAPYLPTPTPRRVMLHTLAHLLIRQLSFECGYATASLRERLYVGESAHNTPMAGILIYTAAGDAEGTMGGLVREGEPERFFPTLLKALWKAEWCSADPVCRESGGQGLGALNLAACHACALLPETSCETGNRLLDRVMLFGTTEEPGLGFFGEIVQALLANSGED